MLSACDVMINSERRELVRHGTVAFPVACYHVDLHRYGCPWHWHDELEAVFVSEGEASMTLGKETFCLHAGDGYFVNSGVLHSGQVLCRTGCWFHTVVFHPRLVGGSQESVFFQKYLLPITGNRNLSGFGLYAAVPWQAEALKAIERAWQACAQEPAFYELVLRDALSALIAAILPHVPSAPAQPDPKDLRNAERVKQMLQFIHQNYGDALNTASIAQSALVSESECLRCFHSVLGTTPIQYLRKYRIERAAQLLAAGGGRIADTAAQCGFPDVSYFTRTFRELKGCTPKEYQRHFGSKDAPAAK